MPRLTMQWQLGPRPLGVAHFFLFREGDETHSDHRIYSRDELARRVSAIQATSGEVPLYYRDALAALDDAAAPASGAVPLDVQPTPTGTLPLQPPARPAADR